MAKKNNDERKVNIVLGLVLIIAALVGIGKLITVLLILLGIYFLYQGIRK